MSELNIKGFQKEVHENAIHHGWHEEERSFGELIALCHAELSEALEEYRKGKQPNETYYFDSDDEIVHDISGFRNKEKMKPEGIPSELADVVIRIMDMCELYGIDLEKAIRIKHEFNKTRPYKHGGKVI